MHVGKGEYLFLDLPIGWVPYKRDGKTYWEGRIQTSQKTFDFPEENLKDKVLVLTIRKLPESDEEAVTEYNILDSVVVLDELLEEASQDQGVTRDDAKTEFSKILPWMHKGIQAILHDYPHALAEENPIEIFDIWDDSQDEGQEKRRFLYVNATPLLFSCGTDEEQSPFRDYGYWEVTDESFPSGWAAIGKSFSSTTFNKPSGLLDAISTWQNSLLTTREEMEDEGASEYAIRAALAALNTASADPESCFPDVVFEFENWFVKDSAIIGTTEGELDRVEYLVDLNTKAVLDFSGKITLPFQV